MITFWILTTVLVGVAIFLLFTCLVIKPKVEVISAVSSYTEVRDKDTVRLGDVVNGFEAVGVKRIVCNGKVADLVIWREYVS